VICRINELPADPNKEQNDAHLQNNDYTVDQGRFLRAPDKQESKYEQDEHCRDVHDAVNASRVMFERLMRPLIRASHIEAAKHAIGELTPCCLTPGCGDGIPEKELPAGHPRDNTAPRRERI